MVCRWSLDKTALTYDWSGTDFITGEKNSGAGILGWDAVKQMVVELEIDADGSTFKSTHHNLKNGNWRSPTKGSMIIDGKPIQLKSLRFFDWKSNDEWHGTTKNRMLDGKPKPDVTTIVKQK